MVMVFPIMSFLEMLHENVFTMNMEVMLGRNVKVFFFVFALQNVKFN